MDKSQDGTEHEREGTGQRRHSRLAAWRTLNTSATCSLSARLCAQPALQPASWR